MKRSSKKKEIDLTRFGLSQEFEADVSRIFSSWTEGKATPYDKAMDSVYNETHIAGAYHRNFDGGHTVRGAYDACMDAYTDIHGHSPETVAEWLDFWGGFGGAYKKDFVTVNGMPVADFSQAFASGDLAQNYEQFQQMADAVKDLTHGVIDAGKLNDLMSVNAMEMMVAGGALVNLWHGIQSNDESHISRAVGNQLVAGSASGNPFLFAIAAAVVARQYMCGKSVDWGSVGGSAAESAVVYGICKVLPGPHSVVLIASIISVRAVRARVDLFFEYQKFWDKVAPMEMAYLNGALAKMVADANSHLHKKDEFQRIQSNALESIENKLTRLKSIKKGGRHDE